MNRFAILVCLMATTATADARNITAIRFSGSGVVTASDGYRPPAVGRGNKIIGDVHFLLPGCLPDDIDGVVDLGNQLEGTGPCENDWKVRDQFQYINVISQFTSAWLTFDHGSLTGVYFSGQNGPNFLSVDTNQFWGGWDNWDPYDYRYYGTWTMTDVRIAYDGAPLPGTVPEPASWALMIAGFGLIGSMQRRRAGRLPTAPRHTTKNQPRRCVAASAFSASPLVRYFMSSSVASSSFSPIAPPR